MESKRSDKQAKNIIDTPDGRFLVLTLTKQQMEAVKRLCVVSYSAGYDDASEDAVEYMKKQEMTYG